MYFEVEEYDYLSELELEHKPIAGPRASHAGENVFAYQWEQLMNTPLEGAELYPPHARLASMLRDVTREITQRHASIAASFITWLGTNCGSALIYRAHEMFRSARHCSLAQCFVAAWAIENIRRPGKSFRMIEAVLAPEDHWQPDLLSNGITLQVIPRLSAEDVETAEHVAYWCGSPEGWEFIRMCETQIKQRERVTTDETVKIMAGIRV